MGLFKIIMSITGILVLMAAVIVSCILLFEWGNGLPDNEKYQPLFLALMLGGIMAPVIGESIQATWKRIKNYRRRAKAKLTKEELDHVKSMLRPFNT